MDDAQDRSGDPDTLATLRALEPALTKTAALLPVIVEDLQGLRRLLPTLAEAVAALHRDTGAMRDDIAEIKALLRNGRD
jgi:hypothetical protein